MPAPQTRRTLVETCSDFVEAATIYALMISAFPSAAVAILPPSAYGVWAVSVTT
jgi:hypothetical protein